jgi:hypothetical protein
MSVIYQLCLDAFEEKPCSSRRYACDSRRNWPPKKVPSIEQQERVPPRISPDGSRNQQDATD